MCAAVLVSACAVWWITSPNAYGEGGDRITGTLPPPGTSLLVGLGPRPADGSVTLADVTPLVSGNTARAAVEVFVCDRPGDGLPPGVVEATAEQYCGRAARVDGYVQSAIRGGPAGPTPEDLDGHIVVQITPEQAGAVEIRGASISYRDGLRRQTQTAGAEMLFTSQ